MSRNKTNKNSKSGVFAGKQVIRLFTQDGVRELLVPSEKPNFYPILLTTDRLGELEEQARKTELKDVAKERQRLAEESRKRKEKFRELDVKLTKTSEKLTEFEQEAKEKANYLLQRAWELRMEQEDDVKAANSLILKTKCQAIRDAQLAEKEIIRKKLQESEKALDQRMEEERAQKLIEEKRKMEHDRVKKTKYVNELNKQIQEDSEKKVIEFEKIIQERERLNQALNAMMVEEVQKQKREANAKERTRRELAKVNEQIQRAHLIEKEEARMADLKVQEWMKQRAEREEAQEREQAEAKRRKELEVARLRAMQEKAGELQARQEHMMAVRRQEEYEREWRKKEKEAAIKKKKAEELCLQVRDKQVKELRQIQAMEIAREKREFDRIMRCQEELQEKERQREEMRLKARQEYRQTLLHQINDKETEMIAKRADELAEGVALRAEADKRKENIRKVLQRKVTQMQGYKIPEVYVADIMRQLHLTDNDK